jgi:carbonic anhydrase
MIRSVLVVVGALAVAGTSFAQRAPKAAWSYQSPTGPAQWGDLDPAYAACKTGASQSPIDIETKDVTLAGDLAPIRFDYRLSPLKIINNGYTVQVNYESGSSITVNGESYELIQFHFHHPSETAIDGEKADLELHLVHRNAQGKLAVIAILMKAGGNNPPLHELWTYLPKSVGHEEEHKKVQLNAADFLPNDRNYYNFSGSLTIPPCTESVTWLVMKKPVEVSPTQIAAFAALYPANARPLQSLNRRSVTKSGFETKSAE